MKAMYHKRIFITSYATSSSNLMITLTKEILKDFYQFSSIISIRKLMVNLFRASYTSTIIILFLIIS